MIKMCSIFFLYILLNSMTKNM